jgi:hypothetical protein
VKRRVLIIVGAILTGAPMPIPVGSLVATTRATIAVGERLLSGSSAGMNAPSAAQLGWYARRVARMSPAEVAWCACDRVLRAAWSRRQVLALSGGGALANQRRGFFSWKVTGRWG